jgi:hypothetical protein
MLLQNPQLHYVCGEGPSKNVIVKCIDSTHQFNNDRISELLTKCLNKIEQMLSGMFMTS